MNKYWLILQQQYRQLATRIDQVVPRERLLLLVGILAVIYALWALLFMFPQRKAIALAKTEEVVLMKQVAQLQQKIIDIEKHAAQLPTSVQALEAVPNGGLVSSSTIVPVFKSLAVQQQGGVLKELINLPDQPLTLSGNDARVKISMPLYEQGVTVAFDSNYAATYSYLQSLESLKWMIFWDELKYLVTVYPNAEVRLTVHTVSKDKED